MEGVSTAGPVASPEPHHAALLLGLGIGGILCSRFPLSILVWVVAPKELRLMDAGKVDTSGRGMTQASRVLGIVGVVISAIILIVWLLIWLLRATVAPYLS